MRRSCKQRAWAWIALALCVVCLQPALAGETLAPPPKLHLDGIPPIPAELAKQTAPHTEVAPVSLLDWHPAKREMLLATRAGNTVQLHRLASPGGSLQQLTDFPDRVSSGSFQPRRGDYIVFSKDSAGDEAEQLHRLNLDTRAATPLTDGARKYTRGPWSHAGDRLVMTAVPLDKSGRGEHIATELFVVDPLQSNPARKLATLPGGGWGGFDWSFDDTRVAAIEYLSSNASRVWIIDAKSGEKALLLSDTVDGKPVAYLAVRFSRDGKGLFLVTDRGSEFRQLAYYDTETRGFTYLTAKLPWDIDEVVVSHDGKLIAYVSNEAGRGMLHVYNADTATELPLPQLPQGSVSQLHWHRGGELGFRVASVRSPAEIYSLDAKTGRLEFWARTQLGMLDTARYREPELIKWKSFDGLEVSGYLYRPPASFAGARPVLINVHGGPESQARPGYLGRLNYLVNELGIALILPNVRGSSGFGKTFLTLDNGTKREDSVKDVGALLDWIATQPDLDAKRVMVRGGSYGGYVSLAVAVAYPELIAGNIDVVGISNFVTFLERTESYRRDLRRIEYGDERDRAMRAFLEKISPLTHAGKIAKPIFVIQGKNDPRVPYTEAQQIVAQVKKNKIPVWYMLAEDEGHGFAKRNNADFQFYAEVRFMERYLLGRE